jgi:zinc D-Ala-D-Ala carboxypeptidase
VGVARKSAGSRRSFVLGAFVVMLATIVAILTFWAPAFSFSPAASPVLRTGNGRVIGISDGVVPDGTTVFSGSIPAVAKLDAALLGALRQASSDSGIAFVVDSGWRSVAYQRQLFRQAVADYGSEEEAAKWVATPQTSAHVSGEAVDLSREPAAWLSVHGASYGLCQIYTNEPWHYELRPDAVTQGCPQMYADAADDPRLQR